MICRILLLTAMTSTICGSVSSHSDGLLYQAEERDDVTIEWRFALRPGLTVSSLKIHCIQLPGLKVFYHLDSSVVEAQHQQFAGRVRCDEEALAAGRVRLHLAGVRAEDSARYLCRMATGRGRKVKEFTLNVTPQVEPRVTSEQPGPATRRRTGLCVGLGLFTAASAFLASCASLIKHHSPGCLK